MTYVGELKRPIGRGRYKVVVLLNEAGPSSGDWTIDTGLNSIVGVIISLRTAPDTDNTVYKVEYSISGGTITITVKSLDVTASAPVSWTEVTGDRTGFAVDIIAIGY